MLMAGIVLMRVRASAPASSQARAISGTRVGASFTNRGRLVRGRQARTTSAAPSGVAPMAAPPWATLGQEMFSSKAAAQGASSSRSSRASWYSRTLWPAAWHTTAQPLEARSAR